MAAGFSLCIRTFDFRRSWAARLMHYFWSRWNKSFQLKQECWSQDCAHGLTDVTYSMSLWSVMHATTTQWWLINCYLIGTVRSVCKIDLKLQKISRIIPPETFIAFPPFCLSPNVAPLITITLSTQDLPCTTPATLCDDMNHPTIPVPIWQLPAL